MPEWPTQSGQCGKINKSTHSGFPTAFISRLPDWLLQSVLPTAELPTDSFHWPDEHIQEGPGVCAGAGQAGWVWSNMLCRRDTEEGPGDCASGEWSEILPLRKCLAGCEVACCMPPCILLVPARPGRAGPGRAGYEK